MFRREEYKAMYKYEDSNNKHSLKKRNTDGLLSHVNTGYTDLDIDLWDNEMIKASGFTTQML